MKIGEPSTRVTLLVAICREPLDNRAWDKFVFLYGPLVLDWCRRYGLQDADARDVVQDVLLQFAKQSRRFHLDQSKRFRGYLRAITHAAWCDWVELRSVGGKGAGDEETLHLLGQIPARDDLTARIEAEYDCERFQIAMRSVKRRVAPRTWEVFRLLAIENLSGAEAAAKVGMAVGSAIAARCKVQKLIREAIDDLDD